jgi:predicted AAA+ superfamily ATPase
MKHWLEAAVEKERPQKVEVKRLLLGAVFLPEEISCRHIFVAGNSGTGKSVCLKHCIQSPNQAWRRLSEVDVAADSVLTSLVNQSNQRSPLPRLDSFA